MNELCELNLVVPSDNTARIQETHILNIISFISLSMKCFEEMLERFEEYFKKE